jgi:hypothetical protein
MTKPFVLNLKYNIVFLTVKFVYYFISQNTTSAIHWRSKNPDEATSVFMEREFPEILEWKTNPHKSLMIPDSFIYGIAGKVNL